MGSSLPEPIPLPVPYEELLQDSLTNCFQPLMVSDIDQLAITLFEDGVFNCINQSTLDSIFRMFDIKIPQKQDMFRAVNFMFHFIGFENKLFIIDNKGELIHFVESPEDDFAWNRGYMYQQQIIFSSNTDGQIKSINFDQSGFVLQELDLVADDQKVGEMCMFEQMFFMVNRQDTLCLIYQLEEIPLVNEVEEINGNQEVMYLTTRNGHLVEMFIEDNFIKFKDTDYKLKISQTFDDNINCSPHRVSLDGNLSLVQNTENIHLIAGEYHEFKSDQMDIMAIKNLLFTTDKREIDFLLENRLSASDVLQLPEKEFQSYMDELKAVNTKQSMLSYWLLLDVKIQLAQKRQTRQIHLTSEYSLSPETNSLSRTNTKIVSLKEQEYHPGDFVRLDKLGEGTFGQAFLVKHTTTNMKMVLKIIPFSDQANEEVEILKRLKHRNIVRYYGKFVRSDNLHIIMEYADGGDLFNLLETHYATGALFPEQEIWNIFKQIGLALKKVHENKIIHRDIKPSNIFICKRPNEDRYLLGDFGVAKILNQTCANTVAGTSTYMAPEIHQNQDYTNTVDIWSLGCILHELCALESPFQDIKNDRPFLNLVKLVQGDIGSIPTFYSSELQKLINQMVCPEPDFRVPIVQLLKDYAYKFSQQKK